ncbi:MAG: M56 family metallopeptidase, partial [Gemmatimonadota bacterium]|nr:M56 family metallopeptidase [Gemmatimonadota bacterium]
LLTSWGAGAGLGLAALLRARLRLKRMLRARSVVADPSLRAMLDDLRERAGVGRTVLLTQTERLHTPFATGSGEICLPTRVVRDLDGEQRRSILAHELAHLLRRDPRWFTCLAMIERVLFFQPLNRVARRRVQESAEFLCDDWAARQVGGLALARCLTEVASWNVAPPQAFAMAGMAGSGPLTRRVERLLSPAAGTDPARRPAWVGVAGGLVTLAVACAPGVTIRGVQPEVAMHVQEESGTAEVAADSSGAPGAVTAAAPVETPEGVVSIAADGTILYGVEASDQVRTVEWAHGPFWQNAAEVEGHIRFESRGRIAFSANGTEVVGLSGGARFAVEEADTSGVTRLEVSRGADGAVHYRYSVDGRPEPWSDTRERRNWLGPLVRELVRISAPGAGAASES